MIFIEVLVLVIILGFIDHISYNKYPILLISRVRVRTAFFFTLSCMLLLFAALLRNPLYGADSLRFYENYLRSLAGMKRIYFEIGYDSLANFSAALGLDYSGFVRIVSLLTLFPIFFVFKKYKSRHWLLMSFVALNYFETFSTLRNYLAVALLLVAYDSMNYGKKKKAIIFTIIAILFHNSSFIFIALYLLSKYIKTNMLWWIGLISFLLTVTVFEIYRPVYSLLTHVTAYYSGYVNHGLHISTMYSCTMLLMFGVILLSSPDVRNMPENRLLINFYGYAACIAMLCPWFPNYDRVVRCTFFFIAILIANLITQMDAKNRTLVYIGGAIWFIFCLYMNQGINVDITRNFFTDTGGIYYSVFK